MTQLRRLAGVVANLVITSTSEELVFSEQDRSRLGLAAVGAAAVGEAVSSTILSSGSSGAEMRMEYFSCLVNGTRIVGKFHKVGFSDGEVVEFVLQEDVETGTLVCRAARSEARRILWMMPYCSRGHVAQKRSSVKWSFIFALGATVVAAIAEHVFTQDVPNEPLLSIAMFYLATFIGMLVVNLAARSRFYPHAHSATEVFASLGYPNPELVDLELIHKQAEERIRQLSNARPPFMKSWCYRY